MGNLSERKFHLTFWQTSRIFQCPICHEGPLSENSADFILHCIEVKPFCGVNGQNESGSFIVSCSEKTRGTFSLVHVCKLHNNWCTPRWNGGCDRAYRKGWQRIFEHTTGETADLVHSSSGTLRWPQPPDCNINAGPLCCVLKLAAMPVRRNGALFGGLRGGFYGRHVVSYDFRGTHSPSPDTGQRSASTPRQHGYLSPPETPVSLSRGCKELSERTEIVPYRFGVRFANL